MTIKKLDTHTSFGVKLFYHEGVKIGIAEPYAARCGGGPKTYVFTGTTPDCSDFACPWNGTELHSLDAIEHLALAWANEQERQGWL